MLLCAGMAAFLAASFAVKKLEVRAALHFSLVRLISQHTPPPYVWAFTPFRRSSTCGSFMAPPSSGCISSLPQTMQWPRLLGQLYEDEDYLLQGALQIASVCGLYFPFIIIVFRHLEAHRYWCLSHGLWTFPSWSRQRFGMATSWFSIGIIWSITRITFTTYIYNVESKL